MNNFVSSFPKEQQEAVKEMIATGNITSEAGIMLNNSMPGLAQSILAQGAAVRSGVKFRKIVMIKFIKMVLGKQK